VKLTRLRLVGFKSFVEPTDFIIEPGLTGVVGPNGCGKSNLVEALRWVMGETSHKSMRASGMDDVIFAGSANRPSRNTAEVHLAIDNEERKAPAAFNDATQLDVSRRIEAMNGIKLEDHACCVDAHAGSDASQHGRRASKMIGNPEPPEVGKCQALDRQSAKT